MYLTLIYIITLIFYILFIGYLYFCNMIFPQIVAVMQVIHHFKPTNNLVVSIKTESGDVVFIRVIVLHCIT